MLNKKVLSLVTAMLLTTGVYAAGTSSTNATATVDNTIDISTALGASMTLSSDLDVINGTFNSNTDTFTIKANSDSTTYNAWITAPAGNWNGTTNQVFAKFGDYKLPVIVTLTGTTNNVSGDGTGEAATGVSVNRTIEANQNVAPASDQSSGYGVDGTDLVGDEYTLTVTLDTDAIGTTDYTNIDDGAYALTLTINTLVTN